MQTDYDAIKSRIRLSSVIRPCVPSLKQVNPQTWKGLCPFHTEKTPSFIVHDDTMFYKCFSCGASGDCVTFLEEFEMIPHAEAVKRMKAEAGIEDYFLSNSQKKIYEAEKRNRLQKMNRFRSWRSKLISDLVDYTNAQWKIYRTALKQLRITDTEELSDQAQTAMTEAVSREKALDSLESMPERDLMEWYDTIKSWESVKPPRWYLTGWRKALLSKGANV